MSANSSFSYSSLNLTSPSPLETSSFSCFDITVIAHIITACFVSYWIFFLPVCIFIFHLGLQRRHEQPAVATSNIDIFTYNNIAMELIGVLGGCFSIYGGYTKHLEMVGIYVYNIITPGQMLFHSLTTVERYVAVVHPVIYLGLRKATAVRMRNISIVCIWTACIGWVGFAAWFNFSTLSIPLTILLIISVVGTSFCSLSVLRDLIHPGPGEGGGNSEAVHHLKRRAFHTVIIITGALLLKLGGDLLCILLEVTGALSYDARCAGQVVGLVCTVPSSYVMPMLFLHRAGKLPWFNYNTESGHGAVKGERRTRISSANET